MGVLKLEEKWISSHCKYFGLKKKKKRRTLKLHQLTFSAATTFKN